MDIQAAQTIKTVKLTVDTGASVSVLPRCIYEEHFKEAPLHQSPVRLVTYSRTPINVLGCMQATVHMDGIKGPAKFCVVDSGTALMGMDLISALHLRIEGYTVYPPSTSTSLPSTASVGHLNTCPVSPTTVGGAIGFTHQVKISPTAVTVRQKLRRLPFSVRSAVLEELNRGFGSSHFAPTIRPLQRSSLQKGLIEHAMHIARWSARLLCFTYDAVYRAGTLNHTADCLSRLPLPAASPLTADIEPELVALFSMAPVSVTAGEFEEASSSCSELASLRQQINQKWPPSVKTVRPMLQSYFKIRHELSVKDNLVFRGSRLVVPVALRSTPIALAHEGHQGIVRTKQRLRDLYWFPCMDTIVRSEISACPLCQTSARVYEAPLQPVPLPEGP